MLAVMDVDGDSEIGGDANVDREGAEDGDVIIVEGDAAGGFLDDEDVVVEQNVTEFLKADLGADLEQVSRY